MNQYPDLTLLLLTHPLLMSLFGQIQAKVEARVEESLGSAVERGRLLGHTYQGRERLGICYVCSGEISAYLFFPFPISFTLPSRFYFLERETGQSKAKSVLSASVYLFCLFGCGGRKLNAGSVRAGNFVCFVCCHIPSP